MLGTGGGIIGSAFDPIHAEQPNYGENQLIQHQRAMYEAEMLLREYQKVSKQLNEWHNQTGGYFDSKPEQENYSAEFDQENNFGATYWESWQYDESWYFKWDPNNAETITRNSSVTISIIGGIPLYTWEVSGTGFTMEESQTMELSNILIADGTACGAATITVTDAFDALSTGYVRCTTGTWLVIAGCPAKGWAPCGTYSTVYDYQGKYRIQSGEYGTGWGCYTGYWSICGIGKNLVACGVMSVHEWTC